MWGYSDSVDSLSVDDLFILLLWCKIADCFGKYRSRDKIDRTSLWSKIFIQNMENMARALLKGPVAFNANICCVYERARCRQREADAKHHGPFEIVHNSGNKSDAVSAGPVFRPVCLLLFRRFLLDDCFGLNKSLLAPVSIKIMFCAGEGEHTRYSIYYMQSLADHFLFGRMLQIVTGALLSSPGIGSNSYERKKRERACINFSSSVWNEMIFTPFCILWVIKSVFLVLVCGFWGRERRTHSVLLQAAQTPAGPPVIH